MSRDGEQNANDQSRRGVRLLLLLENQGYKRAGGRAVGQSVLPTLPPTSEQEEKKHNGDQRPHGQTVSILFKFCKLKEKGEMLSLRPFVAG